MIPPVLDLIIMYCVISPLHKRRLRPTWRGMALCTQMMLISALLLLAGCEGGNTTSSSSRPTDTTVRIEPDTSPNAKNMRIDPLLPPGGDDRPARAGELDRERTSAGLPILDAKGPNLDQLFSQEIKDPDKRMDRLENAVVEIRRDLDAALPAINRLVSIEGDIQQLVTQLQTLLAEEGGAATFTPREQAGTRPAPPAPPTVTDQLIDNIKDQSPESIEPLTDADLAASPPSPVPKIPPIPVESEAVKTGPPPDQGVSVEPMPRDQNGLMTITPLSSPQGVEGEVASGVEQAEPAKAAAEMVSATSAVSDIVTAIPLPIRKPALQSPSAADAAVIEPKSGDVTNAKSAQMSVYDIRIGDHPDKMRIVVDLPAHTTFTTDLDNQEMILIVDLATVPVASATKTVLNDVVASITTQPREQGGQIVFELKKQTKILASSIMPPNGDNPHYRLVIDVAK